MEHRTTIFVVRENNGRLINSLLRPETGVPGNMRSSVHSAIPERSDTASGNWLMAEKTTYARLPANVAAFSDLQVNLTPRKKNALPSGLVIVGADGNLFAEKAQWNPSPMSNAIAMRSCLPSKSPPAHCVNTGSYWSATGRRRDVCRQEAVRSSTWRIHLYLSRWTLFSCRQDPARAGAQQSGSFE